LMGIRRIRQVAFRGRRLCIGSRRAIGAVVDIPLRPAHILPITRRDRRLLGDFRGVHDFPSWLAGASPCVFNYLHIFYWSRTLTVCSGPRISSLLLRTAFSRSLTAHCTLCGAIFKLLFVDFSPRLFSYLLKSNCNCVQGRSTS
jgi:hypothetical protein